MFDTEILPRRRQRLRPDVRPERGGMADPEIEAIERALVERNIPRVEMGRRLGLDSSQVNRIFNGKRRIQRHEMATLREWLWPGSTPLPSGGTIVAMPGMVPLYGWVGAASQHRLTLAEQTVRAYVPMHPAQQHLVGPFALEVADISMSPRYEPGEIVFVAPNRWPHKNQDCVLVTNDAAGYLKRFLSRDQEAVHLFQLNPEGELDFRLDDVASIHAVVGRG